MTPATIRFFPRSTKTVNTKVKGFPIPQDIHLLGFSLLKKKAAERQNSGKGTSVQTLYGAFNRQNSQSCSPHTQQNTQMISTTHSACKCHKKEPGTANAQVMHSNLH